MKERILQILDKSPKSEDITYIMNKINENYTPEELNEISILLDKMEEEALIVKCDDGNTFMPFGRSGLKKGKIDITQSGNAFLICGETKDIFIPRTEIEKFNIMEGDQVVCKGIRQKGGKIEGRIVRIIQRAIASSIGEVYFEDGEAKVKVENNHGINLSLKANDTYLVDGLLVKLKFVKNISTNEIEVEVGRVICHKNAPDRDILEIFGKHDAPTDFSEEVKEEAASKPKELVESDIIGRKDLRKELIITMDGSDTKDIDDAICCKKKENGNFILIVNIADVSSYVKEGSKMWEAALERGTSVYTADKVVPMLPVELSNGICSLNPGVDRLAISCMMEINSKGKIVNSEVYESVINSNKKMTYEEVNKLFDGNPSQDYLPYKETLETMLELSNILDKAKEERNNIEFISSEVKLIIENNETVDVKKREEGKGQNIIENFMIAANITIATLLYNLGSPCVYRVHKAPKAKDIKEVMKFINILGYNPVGKIKYSNITSKDIKNILDQLKDEKDYLIINKKMLRSMDKAIYSPECLGHFALALFLYCHFTSPIRRFSDLLVHYILKKVYFRKESIQEFINKWKNNLKHICEHISETEKRADSIEHETDDMRIAEYMLKHKDEEYEGIVDGTLPKGFYVQTENLINGFVKLETLDDYLKYREELLGYVNGEGKVAIRLGDKVIVKCIGASKEERKVDFALVRKVN